MQVGCKLNHYVIIIIVEFIRPKPSFQDNHSLISYNCSTKFQL